MVITPDHVKEVFHIAKRLICRNNLLPAIQPVTSSSYSRCHTQDSVNVDVSLLLRVVDVNAFKSWVRFGVEGGEHRHECGHHGHRMRLGLLEGKVVEPLVVRA